MAKTTTVSARVRPETLERIEQAAQAFGMTRSALVTELLEQIFGSDIDLLNYTQMLAERNTAKVVGYINDLEEKTLAVMDELGK